MGAISGIPCPLCSAALVWQETLNSGQQVAVNTGWESGHINLILMCGILPPLSSSLADPRSFALGKGAKRGEEPQPDTVHRAL